MIVRGSRSAHPIWVAPLLVFWTAGARAGGPIEIHGDLVAEYYDGELSHPLYNSAALADDLTAPATWSLVQTDLALAGTAGEFSRWYVRATFSPGTPSAISEAWIANEALGPGTLTIGRFYRPRGTPLPLFNTSIPSLLLHAFPVDGAKYRWEVARKWTRFEVGAVRANPISLTGTTIGDAPAIARPLDGTFTDGPTDLYLHWGKTASGDWGSLDVGATATYGRLQRADADSLATDGFLFDRARDRVRQVLDLSTDYNYGPLTVYGELLLMEEGILRHDAWEVGTRHRLRKNLAVVASYGEYRVASDLISFTRPYSWDRKRSTIGAIWDALPGVQILGGYEWNEEDALGPQGHIANDAATLQVLTYW